MMGWLLRVSTLGPQAGLPGLVRAASGGTGVGWPVLCGQNGT
jgi:hypothetical protein